MNLQKYGVTCFFFHIIGTTGPVRNHRQVLPSLRELQIRHHAQSQAGSPGAGWAGGPPLGLDGLEVFG